MDELRRPKAIVFDVYGTLLDLDSLLGDCELVTGEPETLAQLWRLKQLEYSWLRSLMNDYAPFSEITADALDYAVERLGLTVTPGPRAALLGSWERLAPHADTACALDDLAGYRRVVLSNGTSAMLDAVLGQAGLRPKIELIMSAEEAGIFKPHRSVYELPERHLGIPPDEVLFVSSNPWDAAGARRFGFTVAWVKRTSLPMDRLPARPDLVVGSLAELARHLGAAFPPPEPAPE